MINDRIVRQVYKWNIECPIGTIVNVEIEHNTLHTMTVTKAIIIDDVPIIWVAGLTGYLDLDEVTME